MSDKSVPRKSDIPAHRGQSDGAETQAQKDQQHWQAAAAAKAYEHGLHANALTQHPDKSKAPATTKNIDTHPKSGTAKSTETTDRRHDAGHPQDALSWHDQAVATAYTHDPRTRRLTSKEASTRRRPDQAVPALEPTGIKPSDAKSALPADVHPPTKGEIQHFEMSANATPPGKTLDIHATGKPGDKNVDIHTSTSPGDKNNNIQVVFKPKLPAVKMGAQTSSESSAHDLIPAGDDGTNSKVGDKLVVTYKDHTSYVQNPDGTSYVRKPVPGNEKQYVEQHFGPNPHDYFRVKDPSSERENLTAASEKGFQKPDERDKYVKRMQTEMAAFEKRAKENGLPEHEVARTYQEITRLHEGQGDTKLDLKTRQQLALQILHHAGSPDSVRQGSFGTCAAAGAEMRTYTQYPSEAAKLVTDVALTSKYDARLDGTTAFIKDPAFHPAPTDQIERYLNKKQQKEFHNAKIQAEYKDRQRDHASELFQVAAVNLRLAQESENLQYAQEKVSAKDFFKKHDNGERLYDYDHLDAKKQPTLVRHGETGLQDNHIAEVCNMISGKYEKDVVVTLKAPNADEEKSVGLTVVSSKEELRQKLQELARDKKATLLGISVNVQPFCNEAALGAKGVKAKYSHSIVIKNISDDKVEVYNSWGAVDQHNDKNPVRFTELHIAALIDSRKIIPELKKTIEANKQSGHEDAYLQFEYLRLQRQEEQLSQSHYRNALSTALREARARWQREKAANPNHELTDEQKKEQHRALLEFINAPTSKPGVE